MKAEPALALYTIYRRPRDYPQEYVVRRTVISSAGSHTDHNLWGRGGTLNEARATIPPELVCIPRSPEDDPVIVETWI